jgi:cytoskeletal protein CcmA (bactofilin family)
LIYKDQEVRMFRSRREEKNSHFLGSGLRFVGSVRGTGDLVCHGEVEGDIELDGVVQIGPHAKVRGGVKAREADIAGCVEGDVVTQGRVTLRASCNLKGDVVTGQLVVEPGAVLQGQLHITAEQSEPALEPQKHPSSTLLPE